MIEKYLLDTNIVSELCRTKPDEAVLDFVAGLDRFWLSVITVHELRYGIALLPAGDRQTRLATMVTEFAENYSAQLVNVDSEIAREAGEFRAHARLMGKTLHLADALIAASCSTAGELIVCTRNVSDFEVCPVTVFNPFTV